MSSAVATRYAKAIFGLAKDEGDMKLLEKDLQSLRDILEVSEDFRTLISSPMYSREQQETVVLEISKKIKISDMMKNALCLVCSKRRLYILPQLIDEISAYIQRIRERSQLVSRLQENYQKIRTEI
jgi:F-type H+-transporting ATPase subunit delta